MLRTSAAAYRIAAHSLRPATRPGPDTISLSSGDPDFETPEFIRRALTEAVEAGYTHYGDNQGDPELRAALAANASRTSARPIAASEVVMTHGGSGAITAAFLATLDPGDRVLLPEPTYSVYADIVHLIGAEPVYIPQTSNFHLDFDRIEALAPGARMLVLCHPCNPTGIVYTREELSRAGELAQQHDLLVFVDEAYDHIVFDGVEFVSSLEVESLKDHLIYCQTFSKTYAMTGWRLGYLIAPDPVAKEATRMHRTINNALNPAIQRAALAAVTTPTDWPERMRQEYQYRRELVLEMLDGVPGFEILPPDGAFYTFIRGTAGQSSQAMVNAAMERGVAIRAGTEYGPSGEGYVRITFATGRQKLTEGLLRLREVAAVSAG